MYTLCGVHVYMQLTWYMHEYDIHVRIAPLLLYIHVGIHSRCIHCAPICAGVGKVKSVTKILYVYVTSKIVNISLHTGFIAISYSNCDRTYILAASLDAKLDFIFGYQY